MKIWLIIRGNRWKSTKTCNQVLSVLRIYLVQFQLAIFVWPLRNTTSQRRFTKSFLNSLLSKIYGIKHTNHQHVDIALKNDPVPRSIRYIIAAFGNYARENFDRNQLAFWFFKNKINGHLFAVVIDYYLGSLGSCLVFNKKINTTQTM